MKSVTGDILTAIQSSSASLVHCGRVQTQGGVVFGFTEHDTSIVVSGETYYPGQFTLTTISHGSQLAVSNVQSSGPYSATITRSSVLRGLFDNATVRIFLVDHTNPGGGVVKLMKGHVLRADVGEFSVSFQFDDFRAKLGRTITRKFTPNCNAVFGDSRCTVALGPYTVTGTITTVTSQTVLVASALSNPDGYFTGGTITMTSGPASGFSRDVKTFAPDTFTLHRAFPFDVAVGNTFSAVKGCAKTLEACQGYSNYINFRGWGLYIPGTNYQMKGPPL